MQARGKHDGPAGGDARAWRAAVGITLAAGLVRLVFAALLPLIPDETYYWDWSRHLAAGYFDHPPVIALLIRAGTALGGLVGLGHTAFAVRLVPVLAGIVASLATIGIARRLGGGGAARTAAMVLAAMPLVAAGLVLATPDAPLLAAIATGLYAVVRALESPPRSRASLAWWTAAGIALGIAFASKYTSILLPVALTIAVLLRPGLRARLREPGPYVACIVATLVFLPVLRWNAAHDWASFRFQLQHGLGSTAKGSPLNREINLVAGQLGLVSPILFALLAAAVWRTLRGRADDVRFALATVATASWVFFVYSALKKNVEANWPAPSYVPAVALLAALAATPARDRWLRRGIVLGAALSALLFAAVSYAVVAPTLPPPLARVMARSAREVARWDTVNARVAQSVAGTTGTTWLAADRYQDVSKLAYTAPGQPEVFCICLGGRQNQYEIWPDFAHRAAPGDALVAVVDDTPDVHGAVRRIVPYFASVERGALAPLLRGRDTVSTRRLWILRGYRGGWPSRDSIR
ncbi:MAG: putative rane protein [Gemmatimonadetes bacterium]|nr:putative rane protein [Gemmatimonadota bacterium]